MVTRASWQILKNSEKRKEAKEFKSDAKMKKSNKRLSDLLQASNFTLSVTGDLTPNKCELKKERAKDKERVTKGH